MDVFAARARQTSASAGAVGWSRYSFGTAPAHFGLQDYWATLKDPPAVVEIMEAVFGTKDVKQ